MHGSLTPTRITIDFSGAIDPAHGWIIGRGPDRAGRVELLAFPATHAAGSDASPATTADLSGCTCPEFCERDHANE